MKTPPFLLLAALTFWGWQSGLFYFGLGMGVVLESARLIKIRWDLSMEDFYRLWNFCALLAVALALYVFTTDDEGGGNLLHGHANTGATTLSGIHTATTIFRWLPMVLFLFVTAQQFSERETIPLSAISLIARRRQQAADASQPEWRVNVTYPYFIVTLFAAGIHVNGGTQSYFWGNCLLLAWALWPLRARRFNFGIWFGAFLVAIVLGYFGTRGIGQLEQLAQNTNAQWLARFMRSRTDPTQAMTAMGQIGELKLSGAIAVRLETKNNVPPPTYLREASYYSYHAQTWRAGGTQNEFEPVSADTTNNNVYELLPGKTNTAVVNIACYLDGRASDLENVPEGLLPLPSGSSRLDLENLPSTIVAVRENKTGAILVAGPGLAIFDAHYGAGGTIDTPPNTNWDWGVPTNEVSAIQQVTNELNVSGATDERKELAVAQFFASKFTYSVWQGADKNTNETPLANFLLHTHHGHCEYFATATVLLLRELNIPARYAVGFYVHESKGENHYVARERDAHAWCLVWDAKNKTWQDFDTTPGSWIEKESARASATQSISDFFSWLHFQFSKFRVGQSHLRKYVLWAVAPMMAFLLYRIVFRRGRKRRTQTAGGKNIANDTRPGLDSEFYQLEEKLAARGLPRQTGETLVNWLERALMENTLAELRLPLRELLRLHYRHRFDPNGLGADERKSLAQKVATALKILAGK